MSKRRLAVCVFIGCCVLAATGPHTLADDDPAALLNQAQEQQNKIQVEKQNARGKLGQVYWQTQEAKAQLQAVQQELKLAQSRQAEVDRELKTTRASLGLLEAALKQSQGQYQERKAVLGRRVRAIQENGRVSYLGVLVGSHSFADFVSRMDLLKQIVQQDSRLMREVRAQKQTLEKQRQAVADRTAQLTALQAEAVRTVQTVQAKEAAQEQIIAALDRSQAELQAQLAEYDRQQAVVEQQIYEFQLRLNRIAGKFAPVHPLRGKLVITSDFGPRIHPVFGVSSFHGGTDFAANSGDPIFAIEDGVVIHAGWDDVYGNRLVIDHGSGIASWYGHAQVLLVDVGDAVKQGQTIARADSTGLSTGPHLHLEIRVNNVRQNPLNYLAP
ncbi:MAG TPA: peptidoglycan DD-metalloendopeptidase family protein [Symbiobacteriaceae bacterium]